MQVTTTTETALVLRTCDAQLRSHGGFQWPESGDVEAPDWSPEPCCGQGLHGLLWGEGDGGLLSWAEDARWLVVEVDAGGVVDLKGKVKFKAGTVVHCGDRLSATTYLCERAPGRAVVGAQITAGDRGTATAGDRGTATAGDYGTATAGYGGTATAGDYGTIVLSHWDEKRGRRRIVVGYVGEDGIEPQVEYRLNAEGKIVRAKAVAA